MRLRGWGLVRGWISFVAACGLGALANVGIAAYLFEHSAWWMASAIAGVLVGAVWNYAVTAVYTWKQPRVAKDTPTRDIELPSSGLGHAATRHESKHA
jgi:dolichol-phosphate mannosyltransferase